MALAFALAVLLPLRATGDEVRRVMFPAALLGTWAKTPDRCDTKDKSNVVIEKAKYSDGTGTCAALRRPTLPERCPVH